jgi:hypothetical protein
MAADHRALRWHRHDYHKDAALLFRVPRENRWWAHELDATVALPPQLGSRAQPVAAHHDAVSDCLKWQIARGLEHGDGAAKLLAGLHEAGAAEVERGFYGSPMQRDRQWWVGLKRRLYGWQQRWPKACVCPRLAG